MAAGRGTSGLGELKRYFDSVLDPLNSKSYKARHWSLEDILDWYEDSTVSCAHRMMGELKKKRVLEVGFGMGAHLVWLARQGANVVGIDISEERVRAAKAFIEREEMADRISVMCRDVRDAGFSDEKFDIIYGHDILMYMGGDYSLFIKQTRDMLNEGGKMVIVEALDGHPAARIYRKIFAPVEFRYFTRYFDIASLSLFRDNYRYFANEFFYILAPLAFIWKNWFTSKGLFDYFEKNLSKVDRYLLKIFPVFERYCWRVVFEVQK